MIIDGPSGHLIISTPCNHQSPSVTVIQQSKPDSELTGISVTACSQVTKHQLIHTSDCGSFIVLGCWAVLCWPEASSPRRRPTLSTTLRVYERRTIYFLCTSHPSHPSLPSATIVHSIPSYIYYPSLVSIFVLDYQPSGRSFGVTERLDSNMQPNHYDLGHVPFSPVDMRDPSRMTRDPYHGPRDHAGQSRPQGGRWPMRSEGKNG